MKGIQRLALEERLITKCGLSEDIKLLMIKAHDKEINKNTRAFAIDVLYYYVNKLEEQYDNPMTETKRIINLYERQLK